MTNHYLPLNSHYRSDQPAIAIRRQVGCNVVNEIHNEVQPWADLRNETTDVTGMRGVWILSDLRDQIYTAVYDDLLPPTAWPDCDMDPSFHDFDDYCVPAGDAVDYQYGRGRW